MTDTVQGTPDSDKGDPLLRMRVYRLACELVRESWEDADELTNYRAMEKVSAQLYAAVGSIVANLSEGYGHTTGKNRARFFEYALGSTRESAAWFRAAQPVLGSEVVTTRLEKLGEIRRMLTAIIPRERNHSNRPKP